MHPNRCEKTATILNDEKPADRVNNALIQAAQIPTLRIAIISVIPWGDEF